MRLRHDLAALARPIHGASATIFSGRAARVHTPADPLHYAHGPEYRDAGELRRIVDQLPGTRVTLGHPRAHAGSREIGRVVAARVEDGHAVVDIRVDDTAARESMRGVRVELSLGYACVTDTAGYQRNIQVDHLAVLVNERARCGATCAVQTDRADCSCQEKRMNTREDKLAIIKQAYPDLYEKASTHCDEYIDGLSESAERTLRERAVSDRQDIGAPRPPQAEVWLDDEIDEEAAKRRMVEHSDRLWRNADDGHVPRDGDDEIDEAAAARRMVQDSNKRWRR